MSKEDPDDPKFVSAELCDAYRKLLEEKIDGIKKAVYVSAASITTVLAVIQLILTLYK
jgi:hypothetical protein